MASVVKNTTEEAVISAGKPFLHRRIEFHLARRPCNGVPLSSGDFHLETLNPDTSATRCAMTDSGVGSSPGESVACRGRSAGGESHELGMDPELCFRISFKKIGAGLENLGNTCYLNSVLQCLTYTEPFAAYLQSGKHKSTCRAAGFCAMCALQNHVMDALQSSGKILKPFHLVRNLRCISRSFQNCRQEDAHEYMVNLLESMHKCCLPYGVPSESPGAYEKSLVHKIFGGQLRSQVKCMQCSYSSNKFDPFLDLSLEIVGADSLKKALSHFTATEQLDDGERQYQCQCCKEKVKAFKQLTIHKAPYVLSIHLKRFGSCIRGEKINKRVEFGPTLDLKPFVSGLHAEELKYTLYGVLVHAGWSTHSGHYFCYVRTSAGLWYSLDDNHVSQVSEKSVLSREAYMLFYVRNRNSISRSFGVNLKTYSSTNSNGNKGTPLVERKLNNTDYRSSTIEHDGCVHCLPVSLVDGPGKHLLKNQEPLQSSSHATARGSCFQVSEDVLPNGLDKEMLPKGMKEATESVNSKFPSFGAKKCNATNKSAQDTATKLKLENSYTLHSDDKRHLSPSRALSDPVKEAACTKFMEDVANDRNMKCSTSQQSEIGRGSFLELLEAKPAELLKLNTLVSSLHTEKPKVPEMENLIDGGDQKGAMLRKPKIFLTEGYCFGRKQLFLMSLRLHKKCKGKTRKQRARRNKMNNIMLDPCTDSHGASTSETYKPVGMYSLRSFGKDLYNNSGRKSEGEKVVKSGNGSCQINSGEIHRSCTGGDLPGTKKEPCMSIASSIEEQQSVKFKHANDVDMLENCKPSLLKASLKEAPVAKWDVDDVLASQIEEAEDAPKGNVGYLLDEWDEEYDRGKRKKLKSRQWFDGPNPFQETAELKTCRKMMKIVRTTSAGNHSIENLI